MRVISWNVNGVRAIEKKGFIDWVKAESPDALCLQETKARPDQLSEELKAPVDAEGRVYKSWWASARKPGYSGTAIYSRIEPLDVRVMGVSDFDAEGRVIQADFPAFTLISAYFPNSQDAGARLDYKLAFCDAMLATCDALVARGRRLVLCGDYNIAHTPIDLARPKDNEGNPGYLPEERAWMDKFVASGYADTFRLLHPGLKDQYSWWSYRLRAREKNIGWRIDYQCVDQAFIGQVAASVIRPDVLGSDHCPVQIDLNV
jgi:exodeoxyribonuclease-3